MTSVAILRPEPAASATADAAAALGLPTVVVPLFAIAPIEWAAPDPADYDGLLMTSATAVRFGGPQLEQLKGLPVHVVGAATAAAARAAGFTVATVGAGGVGELSSAIDRSQRLLHLAGAERSPNENAPPSIAVIAVYQSQAIEHPAGLNRIEGTVAMVHSPRAGQRLAELCSGSGIDQASIAIAAISERAAIAAGPGWRAMQWSKAPSGEALLALAARLCNSGARNQ